MVSTQKESSQDLHPLLGTPMAETLATLIECWLLTEAYVAGMAMPAERELSVRLGASRQLVRSALTLLEYRGTIERKANCRPIYLGKSISRKASASGRQTFALWLIHGSGSQERAAILKGIHSALDPEASRIFVENPTFLTPDELVDAERRFIGRLAKDGDVSGAIVWCMGGDSSLPALMASRDRGVPFVFIDREPPAGFNADFVGVDNYESARQATRHLIGLGHESIAHVTNCEAVSSVRERRDGYRAAIDAAGFEYRADYQVAFEGSLFNVNDEAFAIVNRLLALKDPPTAMFVVSDYYAFGILHALESLGVRVPEEMAVIGFDGAELLVPGAKTLTTVAQPFERIGARAVELLQKRIQQGQSAPYRHVLLEAPLSIQRSTVSAM